jgi:ATP-dependent exoDNAse (exonuclease V) alpha subunit
MIKLTCGQEKALDVLTRFCTENEEGSMVISGYSGTGKTYVTKALIESIVNAANLKNQILDTANRPRIRIPTIQLAATTNKAAEALSLATSMIAVTIHSYLGIRVKTKFNKGGKATTETSQPSKLAGCDILIIDEASFIDNDLLEKIEKSTKKVKVIYIGDPAQLAPINCEETPVFTQGFDTVFLTEIVRQEPGNQIIIASKSFRDAAKGKVYEPFQPDMNKVVHLNSTDFNTEMLKEFIRPDFTERDAKVLAWTNKMVKTYNAIIKEKITGDHMLKAGDYAVCNNYFSTQNTRNPFHNAEFGTEFSYSSTITIPTDTTIRIMEVIPVRYTYSTISGTPKINLLQYRIESKGNIGYAYACNDPRLDLVRKAFAKKNDTSKLKQLEDWLIDLRPLYACTINKSQGSTYNRVFLDLNDVDKCRNKNQVHRMLYVGFSRASEQVIITGDIKRGL